MKYMILIYSSEAAWMAQSPAEMESAIGAYAAYSTALAQAGKMVDGQELQPVSTARSITVRGGDMTVRDGPYVDTKEQLGGFYLIDVETEAEAIQWAARCPGAAHGAVELRPVVAGP
ncbi:MAG: YciI family protein [Hyphomonadaceae bacterium]|nr:YciI family protein [Hyphomonadaceae bacterium]